MALAPEKEKLIPPKSDQSLEPWVESHEQEVKEELGELEGYLEKIERTTHGQPVLDDQTGQTLLSQPDHETPPITLPLTEEELKQGLHHKIVDGLKWLALFCVRLAKKAARRGIKVEYKN